MLLPNTEDVKKKLLIIENEISKNILAEHHGELYVCFGSIEFGYHKNSVEDYVIKYSEKGDIKESDNLSLLWKNLSEKTSLQKQQKYNALLIENFKDFFEANGKGLDSSKENKNYGICDVTGIEGDLVKIEKRKNSDDEIWVLKNVKKQIELGEALKLADYFITYKESSEVGNKPLKNEFNFNPISLGIHHYLFEEGQLADANSDYTKISSADTSIVRKINKTDFTKADSLKGNQSSYGWMLYGGNKQARNVDEKRGKTFEELAGEDDDSVKLKKLGILRMDVDGLGQIFMNGLKPKQQNLALYSTLSNQLDFFFSGYLNTIRNGDKYRDWVNIIYSGGDDIFAVGRWDLLLQFAKEVRNDFRKFVCNREEIGISAGLAIVEPKFPIVKGADLAGAYEDIAKNKKFPIENNDITKNAITLFGVPLDWKYEFPFVEEFKIDLVNWIYEDKISKGLLMKILDYYHEFKADKISWRWNAAYSLARHHKDKNNEEIKKLRTLLFARAYQTSNSNYTGIEFPAIAVACRWAEYELRNTKL